MGDLFLEAQMVDHLLVYSWIYHIQLSASQVAAGSRSILWVAEAISPLLAVAATGERAPLFVSFLEISRFDGIKLPWNRSLHHFYVGPDLHHKSLVL